MFHSIVVTGAIAISAAPGATVRGNDWRYLTKTRRGKIVVTLDNILDKEALESSGST